MKTASVEEALERAYSQSPRNVIYSKSPEITLSQGLVHQKYPTTLLLKYSLQAMESIHVSQKGKIEGPCILHPTAVSLFVSLQISTGTQMNSYRRLYGSTLSVDISLEKSYNCPTLLYYYLVEQKSFLLILVLGDTQAIQGHQTMINSSFLQWVICQITENGQKLVNIQTGDVWAIMDSRY